MRSNFWSWRLVVALTVWVLLVNERPAHAYIDPGTGSLIYQTILTLVLGLGIGLRRTRETIVRFVKRLGGRGVGPESPGAEP